MSADKYPSIFSRQMDAIVYILMAHDGKVGFDTVDIRRLFCVLIGCIFVPWYKCGCYEITKSPSPGQLAC